MVEVEIERKMTSNFHLFPCKVHSQFNSRSRHSRPSPTHHPSRWMCTCSNFNFYKWSNFVFFVEKHFTKQGGEKQEDNKTAKNSLFLQHILCGLEFAFTFHFHLASCDIISLLLQDERKKESWVLKCESLCSATIAYIDLGISLE